MSQGEFDFTEPEKPGRLGAADRYVIASSAELRHLLATGVLLHGEEIVDPAEGWALRVVEAIEVAEELRLLEPRKDYVPVVLEVKMKGFKFSEPCALPAVAVSRAFFSSEKELDKFKANFSGFDATFIDLIPMVPHEGLFQIPTDREGEKKDPDGAEDQSAAEGGEEKEKKGGGEEVVEGGRFFSETCFRRISAVGGAMLAARQAVAGGSDKLQWIEDCYTALSGSIKGELAPLYIFLQELASPGTSSGKVRGVSPEDSQLAVAMAGVVADLTGEKPGPTNLLATLRKRIETTSGDVGSGDTRNEMEDFLKYLEEVPMGKESLRPSALKDSDRPERSSFKRAIILLLLDAHLLRMNEFHEQEPESRPGPRVLFTGFILAGALWGLPRIPKAPFGIEADFMGDLSLRLAEIAARDANDRNAMKLFREAAGSVELTTQIHERSILFLLVSSGHRHLIQCEDRIDPGLQKLRWQIEDVAVETGNDWKVEYDRSGKRILLEVADGDNKSVAIAIETFDEPGCPVAEFSTSVDFKITSRIPNRDRLIQMLQEYSRIISCMYWLDAKNQQLIFRTRQPSTTTDDAEVSFHVNALLHARTEFFRMREGWG